MTTNALLADTLLALLAPASGRPEQAERLTALALSAIDADGWQQLLRMVGRHRLGPVLRWRLRNAPRAGIPVALLTRLDQRYRRAAHASVKRQRDLVLLFRTLDEAGIPAVALKGAWLAWHAYPQPALRLMRDLDVLVPEAQALRAFEWLLAHGFQRDPQSPGDAAAHMRQRKHLPVLIAPAGTPLEVHHRLVEWRNPLAPDAQRRTTENVDLAESAGYWRRLVTLDTAGYPIRFPDPTDLLLRLQAQLFGTTGLAWPEQDPSGELSAEMISALGPLLLGDTRLGREGRMSKESDAAGGLALALRHGFASPEKLAALFTVPAESWRVYAYYPRYWWRLLAMRLPAYLKARRDPGVVQGERERARLEDWLRKAPGSGT